MSQNTAVYKSFVQALKAKFEEAKAPIVVTDGTDTGLPENKGWVRFESTVNGHKLYVPKSELRMGQCETTCPVAMRNGGRPLPKFNGKIAARFVPDVDLIASTVIPLMADPAERLPANAAPGTRKSS